MRFRLEADFVFDADDVADAERRLAAHFLRSSPTQNGVIAPQGPQGYIFIVPVEEDEPTDFS